MLVTLWGASPHIQVVLAEAQTFEKPVFEGSPRVKSKDREKTL